MNGCLPDRVVVFRDGVGDGQMKIVEEYEVEQLRKCFVAFCKERMWSTNSEMSVVIELFYSVAPDYKPKLSVVIVQKRINTRLLLIQVDKRVAYSISLNTFLGHSALCLLPESGACSFQRPNTLLLLNTYPSHKLRCRLCVSVFGCQASGMSPFSDKMFTVLPTRKN